MRTTHTTPHTTLHHIPPHHITPHYTSHYKSHHTTYHTAGETHILNMLKPWLLRTIAPAVFAPYVLPDHMHVPLEPGAPDTHKPEGLLEVRDTHAYMGHSARGRT